VGWGKAGWKMRGQKVVPGKGAAPRRGSGKASSTGGSTGGSAVCSPAIGKPRLDTLIPMCTGCGVPVSNDTRALQCDKCVQTCIPHYFRP